MLAADIPVSSSAWPRGLRPHAEALPASVGEDHIVWSSDWPRTQHNDVDYGSVVSRAAKTLVFLQDETAVQTLFGIS